MKLSIVIPVFNEKSTIVAVIEKVQALELDKEIIVVDDGSTDGTAEVLRALGDGPGRRIHYNPVNLGKGASVRIGFAAATGDIVTVQDADLELDPQEYLSLLRPFIEDAADVVYGSRFVGGQRHGKWSFYLANRALAAFTNVLFHAHLTDMETCYKLLRRDILPTLKLRAARFEIEPELTAQILKRGYRLVELPIGYQPRSSAEGKKISWRDGFAALYTLVDQRLRD